MVALPKLAESPPIVALAGNPNSGKTTLFNALTGLNYKVANYPGVTVEKKEGKFVLDGLGECKLVDLPGIYSLSGTSLDEQIATKALLGDLSTESRPDIVVVVIDATNLERNLYLVSQLVDHGFPVMIAISMMDLAEKGGISVKKEILSRALSAPVVSVVAPKGKGLDNLRSEIEYLLRHPQSGKKREWLPNQSLFESSARKLGKLAESKGRTEHDEFIVGADLLSEVKTPSTKELRTAVLHELQYLRDSGIDPESFEATERYRWINGLVRHCVSYPTHRKNSLSDKIDRLTTHRVWGVVTFLALMAFIFQSIFMWASIPMEFIDQMVANFGTWVGSFLAPGTLRSLLTDGVVAGVGSVLVFVPQIAILFFFIGLLEDSGYLARAAFVTDRIMRKVGLQGRSFIPLLSSFACAIPGIMATRTIPTFADRLATILVAPLMSCSARLPVYTLLIAAFIPSVTWFGFLSLQGITLFSLYLLGILGALTVAWILKKTMLRGQPAFFVMEMPPFRTPSIKLVLRSVVDRVWAFIKNAGTIILACSLVLWFLASYPDSHDSYAKRFGHFVEPVIKPLGYNWEVGVGILASFAAREVFVSSLATVYNVSDEEDTTQSILSELEKRRANGSFTIATALSLLVFYVFACQCMSTLAVCRRETNSWGWTSFMFFYMTVLAYGTAYITYRIFGWVLS